MKNYGSFYRTYKEKLFGYLIRRTVDYHLSSDIMQESFARFLNRYGPESENVPLLFTIARNALLDHFRKKTIRNEQFTDIEGVTSDPEQQFLIREEYQRVLAAMEKLERDERDILSLTVSSDMTYREIASVVGISEANVKVKVHRARIKIRKLLETGEK